MTKLDETPGDRESAANLLWDKGTESHARILSGDCRGEWEGDLVQAFARHRLSTEAAIVAWLRAESARIQELMSDEVGMSDMRIGVQLKVDQIADAIEQEKHRG